MLVPPEDKFNHVVVQHVLQFDESPRFRMWYASWDDWQTLPSGQQIRFANSYATSEDGKSWNRPNLRLHTVKGLAGPNNVVLPYGLIQGLFYDPHADDPEQRFQALVCVERKNPVLREGYYLHTSPDGIHWKGDLSQPIIPSLSAPYAIPQVGIGDTTRFWWDPLRRKYVGDVKFVIYQRQRARGVMESDDLIHWSRPTPTFLARTDDSQIYGHRGFAYQGMYVGMRWVFLPDYSQRHSSLVELDCSRDGRVWTRVGAGHPFMALNRNHDTWDATIMRPVSMLEVGEEVWIYYFGAPTEIESANPDLLPSEQTEYAARLATILRDRFASMNAGDQVGTLVTRPLSFPGTRLHVNATVSANGFLEVSLLNRDGSPVDRFGPEDCQPITGDSIDHSIQWKSGKPIPKSDSAHFRIRFEMQNAKLFSFWLE